MQNTPVHTHLWHRDFWLMVLANLLLCMSVYMLIPVLPTYLMDVEGMSVVDVGIVMGVYSIGLIALGPFCNWLIQQYRRNRVCMVSALAMALSLYLLWHGKSWMGCITQGVYFSLVRFVLGAMFGMSEMVLCSTLIVDVSESQYRTKANDVAAWFGRFALALGPMVAILISRGGIWMNGISVFDVAVAIALVAVVLVLLVRFPFKIPDEGVPVVGLDRFFLPSSWLLFVNLMMMTVALGLVLTYQGSEYFYALVLLGFFMAFLADRFVFTDVPSKVEVVAGMILMGVAVFLFLLRLETANYISPVLIGIGVGIIGSRFLLYFIQVSHHCQRGTSQSSYFLAWEGGLGMGLGLGYALGDKGTDAMVSLLLIVGALIGFVFLTYPWSERHKKR